MVQGGPGGGKCPPREHSEKGPLWLGLGAVSWGLFCSPLWLSFSLCPRFGIWDWRVTALRLYDPVSQSTCPRVCSLLSGPARRVAGLGGRLGKPAERCPGCGAASGHQNSVPPGWAHLASSSASDAAEGVEEPQVKGRWGALGYHPTLLSSVH